MAYCFMRYICKHVYKCYFMHNTFFVMKKQLILLSRAMLAFILTSKAKNDVLSQVYERLFYFTVTQNVYFVTESKLDIKPSYLFYLER